MSDVKDKLNEILLSELQQTQKLMMSGTEIDLLALSTTQQELQKIIKNGIFTDKYLDNTEIDELEDSIEKSIKTAETEEIDSVDSEVEIGEEILAIGQFIQAIRGGYVENTFLPEKMVRDIGLESGDECEIVGEPDDFYVQNIKEAENPLKTPFHTIKYCKAKLRDGKYIYFDEDLNGDSLLSWSSIPKYEISIVEAKKRNIKVGTLVDFRFDNRKDKPKLEMVWIYRDSEFEAHHIETTYKAPKKVETREKKTSSPDNAFDLKGAKIAIFSGSQFESKWREAIEENNGELLFFDTPNKMTSKKERIAAIMSKADLTLIPLDMMSHGLYYTVKDLSKQKGYATGSFYKFSSHAVFEAIRAWKEERK